MGLYATIYVVNVRIRPDERNPFIQKDIWSVIASNYENSEFIGDPGFKRDLYESIEWHEIQAFQDNRELERITISRPVDLSKAVEWVKTNLHENAREKYITLFAILGYNQNMGICFS